MRAVDPHLTMKWGLICSVPEETNIDELTEFSEWFLQEVAEMSHKLGLSYCFEDSASFITQVSPGDAAGCTAAYCKMLKIAPAVHVVLHILPQAKSDEYDWMKRLATKVGVIRQGVLLQNALTRFSECGELQFILGNVIQWINRSAYSLSSMKIGQNNDRRFDIRVGQKGSVTPVRNFSGKYMQAAVNAGLHGSDATDESAVEVKGFPPRLNDFGVAQLFGELSVNAVSIVGGTATVIMANKFHAYQAVQMLNNKEIDRRHKLQVTALSKEVVEKLNAA